MKICFFVPKVKNCGPVNVVINLIKEFVRYEGVQVQLVAVRGSIIESDYSRLFKKLGVSDVVSLDGLSFLEKIRKLNSIIDGVDIIHSHCFFPDLFVSLLKNKKAKKVSTVHCCMFSYYVQEYGRLEGLLAATVHHLILGGARFNSVIACSESLESYLLRFSIKKKENIRFVCNGVDHDVYFTITEEEKNINRVVLGIENDAMVYVYCGRLGKGKRVPELVKLFVKKMNKDSDLLLIIGDGDERGRCEEMAKGSENVRFLGFVSDPVPYYQVADYVLSNSSAEGYPMSIIEALSCGTLAYLSDIEPHNELMRKYPNLVFPLESIKNKNKDKVFSKEDFDIEIKGLSSKKMAEEYYDIYTR